MKNSLTANKQQRRALIVGVAERTAFNRSAFRSPSIWRGGPEIRGRLDANEAVLLELERAFDRHGIFKETWVPHSELNDLCIPEEGMVEFWKRKGHELVPPSATGIRLTWCSGYTLKRSGDVPSRKVMPWQFVKLALRGLNYARKADVEKRVMLALPTTSRADLDAWWWLLVEDFKRSSGLDIKFETNPNVPQVGISYPKNPAETVEAETYYAIVAEIVNTCDRTPSGAHAVMRHRKAPDIRQASYLTQHTLARNGLIRRFFLNPEVYRGTALLEAARLNAPNQELETF